MAARSFKDLGPASKDLAAAVQKIGVWNWPRYLADAESRAKAPVADGLLSKIMPAEADNKSDTAKFIQIGGLAPGVASVNDVLHLATPKPGQSAEPGQYEKVGFLTTNESEARRKLGMSKVEFREAIHKLKEALHLCPADDLEFHIPSGNVFYNGEEAGNLFDE